ncbi:MAG: hypothetical protein CMQ54_00935 [Gammaproteobacteria bacterium]|nr:hypothetical protein [Gammaproteobacteria bacterium]|tara:strand:- start:3536 stop:4147 length:612 start_codon:yes stop_codon:yes gene_type:complete
MDSNVSRTSIALKIFIVIFLFGIIFYASKFLNKESTLIEKTQPLKVVSNLEFTLQDLNGIENSFSNWHGKHRIVNFWATWCAPCRREIPLLKSFQKEFGNKNGYQVIGVAVDFLEPVKDYAKDIEFNYPILIGEKDAIEVAELSGLEFIGLPFTMFVTSDGQLLSSFIGEIHQSHLDAFTKATALLDRNELSISEARSILNKL